MFEQPCLARELFPNILGDINRRSRGHGCRCCGTIRGMNTSEPNLSTFRLRKFRQSDAADCCAVFLSNVPKFFRAEELPEFQNYLESFAEGDYWVVGDGSNTIVACGGIRVKPDGEGSLCFGMVRADLHKRGLGSALIAFRMIELLKADSLKKIRLDTSQFNPGFFSRFGFKETQVQQDYYGAGLHRHDMELDLADCDREALRTLFRDLVNKSAISLFPAEHD
jgi:N-acetylglutamate synthase-like GNAT family acetyltransferase